MKNLRMELNICFYDQVFWNLEDGKVWNSNYTNLEISQVL